MIWGAHPYFWVDTHILQLVMKSRGLFIMSGQITILPKPESFGDFGEILPLLNDIFGNSQPAGTGR